MHTVCRGGYAHYSFSTSSRYDGFEVYALPPETDVAGFKRRRGPVLYVRRVRQVLAHKVQHVLHGGRIQRRRAQLGRQRHKPAGARARGRVNPTGKARRRGDSSRACVAKSARLAGGQAGAGSWGGASAVLPALSNRSPPQQIGQSDALGVETYSRNPQTCTCLPSLSFSPICRIMFSMASLCPDGTITYSGTGMSVLRMTRFPNTRSCSSVCFV